MAWQLHISLVWVGCCLALASGWNSTGELQTAQGPVVSPAPAQSPQGTNPADLEGLSSLRSSLSLTAGQIVELKWGRSKEPCGRPTCPLNQCSWNGIACTNWRVTELDISSRIVTETPLLLGGTLPPQLSNLSMLESINASGHTLGGSLPPEWGELSSLRTIDLSSNALTGTLPAKWSGMTSIVDMNFTHNNLQGAVPQAWAALFNLQVLDVSNNSICQSTFISSSVTIKNGDPVSCSSRQVFAQSVPVAAPGASGVSPPATSPTPPSPPPPPFNQGAQQPILQMSTGINIAVSVVIGAFLLFGIVAGAVRVRRQQNAHRAWLTARMEAMRRAEREEEEAFQRHLKSLVPPKLAVDPSGEVVTLAVRLDPPDPDQGGGAGDEGGDPPGGGSGGGQAAAPRTQEPPPQPDQTDARGAQEASSASPPSRENPLDGLQYDDPNASMNAAFMRFSGGRAATLHARESERRARERVQALALQRAQELERDRQARRLKKLPMFIIDAYLTPAGAITFNPDEAVAAAAGGRSGDVAISVAEDTTPPASGVGGGIRNLWANIRGGREGQTDVEAGRAASTSAQAGTSLNQASNQSAPGAGAPRPAGAAAAHHDPSVAARVRERIEQLRADELPGGPRTPEGPAPPPPVIRWGAMRRFFGMETEAAREARLQQELVQEAERENSVVLVDRAGRAASTTGASQS